MNITGNIFLTAVVSLAFACLVSAHAADLSEPKDVYTPAEQSNQASGMHGSFSLYGWYAGWISGDLGIGGLGPADVGGGDGGSVDSFDVLDGVFMAKGDIRYGRVGLYADFIYVGLADRVSGPIGFLTADWDLDMSVATATGTYSVVATPDTQIQAMAGVRYWNVDAGLTLTSGGGGVSASAADSLDVFDVVIGIRGEHHLTEKVFFEGTGLIGAGDSDFMWDVYAGIGYNFTQNISTSIGWRGMGIDYQNGGTIVDLTLHGPIATLTFKH